MDVRMGMNGILLFYTYSKEPMVSGAPGGWMRTMIKAVHMDETGKVLAYAPRQSSAYVAGGWRMQISDLFF